MKRNALMLLLLMAGTLLALPSCAGIVAASPDADGEIEIVMTDYAFDPDVIRLQVGQTVHLVLRNEGSKMHEFMAGRNVQIHGNFTEPFAEDFFAGLDLEITGPGMVMGMEGMDMDMGGMEMEGGEEMQMEGDDHAEEEGEHAEDEMEMSEGEMQMDGDDHAEEEGEHAEGEMEMSEDEMQMEGDDHAEEEGHAEEGAHTEEGEMAMEGDDHDEGEAGHEEEAIGGQFGAIQRPEMDAHAGLMVMIDPQMIPAGEETVITFTVPEEKVGRWEFGCFQEQGQHYDDGMNGVIIVEQ